MKPKFYYKITEKGYIYDKRIFWGAMVLIIAFFFLIAYKNDFSLKYEFTLECKPGDPCGNPLAEEDYFIYNSITGKDYKKDCTAQWCNEELLPTGKYGKKPDRFYYYFTPFCIALVVLGLLLNHLLHNKGKKPDLELNISKRWKDSLKKTWDEMEDK